MDLLLATRSSHKLHEIRALLADLPRIHILDLDSANIAYDPAEEEIERFDTFEDNAAAKARYFGGLSGLPTIADDSGLAVDALGGAPGVRSKRFAPDEGLSGRSRDLANNDHLVALLGSRPPEERTARYVCVAALLPMEGPLRFFRGEAEGQILSEGRGAGGFGYDPLFYDPELSRTFAELSEQAKNERSHRGRAFRAVAAHLRTE